jgi:pyridoxal phosphate enzyme (YggS family)
VNAAAITRNLSAVKERITKALDRSGLKSEVAVVAVTKTHSAQTIVEACLAGVVHIGENRVQEAAEKFSRLPKLKNIQKRMIGHLQSNKVKKCLDLFDTVDSVDSLKLAQKIAVHARAQSKTIPVFLEVNTSSEEAKYGFDPAHIDNMLACCELDGISVRGLMTIGPLWGDETQLRESFANLRNLKAVLNQQLSPGINKLIELSMGMSGDFELAIEEGSTMIRLGTILFGPRKPYS